MFCHGNQRSPEEKPVVYILYVQYVKNVYEVSVYECRNKAKHVCLLYMCLNIMREI